MSHQSKVTKSYLSKEYRFYHCSVWCPLKSYPLDTGRKLNVHKTFRRRPGRLLNVLCTFNLHPESRGYSFKNSRFQICIYKPVKHDDCDKINGFQSITIVAERLYYRYWQISKYASELELSLSTYYYKGFRKLSFSVF